MYERLLNADSYVVDGILDGHVKLTEAARGVDPTFV